MTMRMLLFIPALCLAATGALAAGGSSSSGHSGGSSATHSSGAAKASNRFQANWTLPAAGGAQPAQPPSSAHEAESVPSARAETPLDSPRMVELPIIVAPIVVDGRLVNYAFVTVRLDVAEGHDPWKVRDKSAYLRDALLRAAHAEPLNDPSNSTDVSQERVSRVWTAAANDLLGGNIVRDVRVVASDARHPALHGAR